MYKTNLAEFPHLLAALSAAALPEGRVPAMSISLSDEEHSYVMDAEEELSQQTPDIRRRVVALEGADADRMVDYCPITMNLLDSAIDGGVYRKLLVDRPRF